MKQFFSVSLAVILVAFSLNVAKAVAVGDPLSATPVADKVSALSKLNILRNEGSDYRLDDALTRRDAIVYVVRLIGKEPAVLADKSRYASLAPGDVDPSADFAPYVGFAIEQGIVKGFPDGSFRPERAASEREFLTMMLRAFGHAENEDFTWDEAGKAAFHAGFVLDPAYSEGFGKTRFTRGDAFHFLYNALTVAHKTNYTIPIQELVAAGTASREAAAQTGLWTNIHKRNSAEAPTVDRFGQVASATFPEKVHTVEQLKLDAITEKAYYDSLEPPKRDAYGGLPGSREALGLTATGFFHTERLADGRTVMVTPEGNLFFMLGVSGAGSIGDTYTLVTGREHIYEWLPEYSADSPYATAFLNGHKDYFSFYAANKIRKTGKPFDTDEFHKETIGRLTKWGFNADGGWSDSARFIANDFPTVRHLSPLNHLPEYAIEGLYLLDIFTPGIEEKLDAVIRELVEPYKNAKSLIGYFLDNEMSYYRLAQELPGKAASKVPSKKRLVDLLKEKYKGDIEAFNQAWAAEFTSFDELYESPLRLATDAAAADMYDFMKLFAETYYKTITDIFRKYDQNHMLLGDRWLGVTMLDPGLREALCSMAGKYMDVISYNYYTYELDLALLEDMYEKSGGKPILLTEFQFSSASQGLTRGVKIVKDETERAAAYRNYVEQAAASGYVAGVSWFQYLDQATSGRWFQGYDGENFGTGLLNVADRPYKEFLDAVMQTNYDIYDLVLGKKTPFKYAFDTGQSAGDGVLNIPAAGGAVVIDGELDDAWAAADPVTLGIDDLATGTDDGGFGADFRFAWDNDHLYVFAQLTDKTPMQNPHSGADIWNGDAIELFVGGSDVDTGGAIKPLDRQIILRGSLVDGKPYGHWYNTDTQSPLDIAVKDAEGGYVIEAAIPWSALNVSDPGPGRELRFDFGADNGDGTGRIAQLLWNGVDGNHVSREKWGKAVLTDAAPKGIVEIPRTTGVVIDGELDSGWTGSAVKLGRTHLATGTDDGSFGADFRFAWDNDHLYVFAQLTDKTPMQNPHSGADIWNGDAIELFVGGSDVDAGGTIKPLDRQIILRGSLVDGKPYGHWYNTDTQSPLDIAVKDAEGGYVIEAAIPWSALNVSDPGPGRELRFDFGADNGDGTGRIAQLLWNGVDGNHVSREKWGKAILR